MRPYPISIEWPPAALADAGAGRRMPRAVRAALRPGLPTARIGVGIERFDYTKGIVDRMQRGGRLLELPSGMARQVRVHPGRPPRPAASSTPTASCRTEATRLADAINAALRRRRPYKPIMLVDPPP